jgi:hypothetical protein
MKARILVALLFWSLAASAQFDAKDWDERAGETQTWLTEIASRWTAREVSWMWLLEKRGRDAAIDAMAAPFLIGIKDPALRATMRRAVVADERKLKMLKRPGPPHRIVPIDLYPPDRLWSAAYHDVQPGDVFVVTDPAKPTGKFYGIVKWNRETGIGEGVMIDEADKREGGWIRLVKNVSIWSGPQKKLNDNYYWLRLKEDFGHGGSTE